MTKSEMIKRAEEILKRAESEKRNPTEGEEIELNGLEIEIKKQELLDGRTQRSIPLSAVRGGEHAEPANEFATRGVIGGLGQPDKLFWNGRIPVTNRTMAGYIREVIQGANYVPDESRAMEIGTGALGGYGAPETWSPGFWSATNNESVCLPMCRIFNFEGNNVLYAIAWDNEDQSAGPFGGVAADWTAEGATSTPKDPKIRMVTYKANKLTIYVDVTREGTQHVPRLVAELGSGMTRAAVYEFDSCIISGNGVARPLGILESGSAINISRAAANAVDYADIVNMYRRLYPGFIRGAAWLASPDVIGELLTLQDPASQYIWTPSADGVANSRPGFLLGLPVYLTDKCPKLGDRGDLILTNLGAYGVAVAEQVVLEKTESAKWYQDIYSFRAILRADGGPLMDSVITPRNGGASLSWAVVLD